MSTKWIIISILAALWVAYQAFFNKEEKGGGSGPDMWPIFRLLLSIVILLLLCFATALIFK